jgi:hypothetical protein
MQPQSSGTCVDCGTPLTTRPGRYQRCRSCGIRAGYARTRVGLTGPNPTGLCQCGCGELTPIAQKSDQRRGYVKDHPIRYINGHQKKRPLAYTLDVETNCWMWEGAVDDQGYAQIKRGGRGGHGHRVVWEETHGPVPDGLELDHICKRRRCINPDHLEAVTHATNCQRSSFAKLTPADVAVIRSLFEEKSDRIIGQRFGVSDTAIRNIRIGKSWRGVGIAIDP